MSLFLLLGAVIPVSAANYTAIPGTSTTLKKYLVVEADAEIPEAEFTFTMSAGSAVEATATTVKTWAGLNPELVKVNGTAGSGKVNFAAGEAATAGALDGVATAEQKYAEKNIVLDFSAVNYAEPGVYRYKITEAAAAQGSPIKHDDEPVRTVDVYVEDNNGALVVAGYVVYEGDITDAAKTLPSSIALPDLTEWDAQNPAPAVVANPGAEPVQADYQLPDDGGNDVAAFEAAHDAWVEDKEAYDQYLEDKAAYDEARAAENARQEAANLAAATAKTPENGAEASSPKNEKYVNTMDSADLKVKKTVTGNSGSRDQYFEFTITVNNAGAGTVMTLDMSGAENGVTHENSATSFAKADMDAANQKDDMKASEGKAEYWTSKGLEFPTEQQALADAGIAQDSGTGHWWYGGTEYDTKEEAMTAADVRYFPAEAGTAGKAGQQIVADENGSATFKVYLHHGQEAVLKGLPVGATYTVAETAAAGYETKYNVKIGNAAAEEMNSVTGEEIGTDDVEVDTINHRNGVIPTGILVSAGLPLAVGAVAAGLFIAKRNKEDEE